VERRGDREASDPVAHHPPAASTSESTCQQWWWLVVHTPPLSRGPFDPIAIAPGYAKQLKMSIHYLKLVFDKLL
jgi:hypothetical protein